MVRLSLLVELPEPVASSLAPEVSWLLRVLVEASSSAHAEALREMVGAEGVALDLLPLVVVIVYRLLRIGPLLAELVLTQSSQVLAA